jgi:hypothetical protein
MPEIRDNLARTKEEMEEVAIKSGRKPEEIKLVAVSKTQPLGKVLEAYDAGHRLFGENRVQEAIPKIQDSPDDIEWHLIGHLQTNKAKKAASAFNIIESVDSIKLASALEKEASNLVAPLDILLQVDLAGEETKFGVEESSLFEFIDFILSCENLKSKGLMCIPPFFTNPEDSRPFFRRMFVLFEKVNSKYASYLTELSMGMSNDYKVAIEEGATIVRIGTAIFGERQYH